MEEEQDGIEHNIDYPTKRTVAKDELLEEETATAQYAVGKG